MFSTVRLCTRTHIEDEVRDLTGFLQVPDNKRDDYVLRAIDSGKEWLRISLQKRLPDIFSNYHNASVTFDPKSILAGYSQTDLDAILDKIQNLSELKRPNVAKAMEYLCIGQISNFRSIQAQEYESLVLERDYWKK